MSAFQKFPILLIEGEAGSGKTSTTSHIVMKIFALDGGAFAISEQSRFTLMKHVDGSNAIPVVFEENKETRRAKYKSNDISNMIRETYDGHEGSRGRADQSMITYVYRAPVAIVGETGFAEAALLDRFVTAAMSRKVSKPYFEAFKQIQSLPLEKLGRKIVESALRATSEDVKMAVDVELDKVSEELTDRPRFNAAVARFGLTVLDSLLGTKTDAAPIDVAIHKSLSDDGSNRKSSVSIIIETMIRMCDTYYEDKEGVACTTYTYKGCHLESGLHYERDTSFLMLHLETTYDVFRKFCKYYDFEGDILPKTTLQKQLKSEPYFVQKKPIKLSSSGTLKNVWVLDIKKMKEEGLEIPSEWVAGTPKQAQYGMTKDALF
jgi:hypothetical protein